MRRLDDPPPSPAALRARVPSRRLLLPCCSGRHAASRPGPGLCGRCAAVLEPGAALAAAGRGGLPADQHRASGGGWRGAVQRAGPPGNGTGAQVRTTACLSVACGACVRALYILPGVLACLPQTAPAAAHGRRHPLQMHPCAMTGQCSLAVFFPALHALLDIYTVPLHACLRCKSGECGVATSAERRAAGIGGPLWPAAAPRSAIGAQIFLNRPVSELGRVQRSADKGRRGAPWRRYLREGACTPVATWTPAGSHVGSRSWREDSAIAPPASPGGAESLPCRALDAARWPWPPAPAPIRSLVVS